MTRTLNRRDAIAAIGAVIGGVAVVGASRFVSANASPSTQVSASPEASPMASPAASGTPVSVEMIDIAFNPTEFTIAANTDAAVSLPNNGVTVHSFVVNDHKNEGKPNLNIKVEVQPGQTGTATINAPAGDYYFWCDIPGHEAAGMYGTMHVQ